MLLDHRDLLLALLSNLSPMLNGHVERAQRTHPVEFYNLYMDELDMKRVNRAKANGKTFTTDVDRAIRLI